MKSVFLMVSSSKGKQVIIPDAVRSYILHQPHAAHLGIKKTRLLMRESVYWPNIYTDIETMVKCCAVCQESQTEHRQQHILAHDVPSTPWTKVASDMFQIKGDNYLLVTEYHSKCTEQPALQSQTSLHNGSACLDHHSKQ